MAGTINEALDRLRELPGFTGAAVTDAETGMSLGFRESGGGESIPGAASTAETAAAQASEILRAQRKAARVSGGRNREDGVEEMVITTGRTHQLIRPLGAKPNLFFFVTLDRSSADLEWARRTLSEVERSIRLG